MASVQTPSGFQGPGQLPSGLTKEMIGQVYAVRLPSRCVAYRIPLPHMHLISIAPFEYPTDERRNTSR